MVKLIFIITERMINMINFKALFMAIYLFFVGLIYGDEPIKLEYSYDIPSQVTVYEAGDSVKIDISVTNVGRPFKGTKELHKILDVVIYSTDGYVIYNRDWYPTEDSETKYEIIKKGLFAEKKYSVRITNETPKGSYNMSVKYCGAEEHIFENIFEVKGVLL